MELEITLPAALPVMTLRNVALFPQALLPLHIFEPRYRLMLRDVLRSDRLFAVAGLNEALVNEPGQFEPPHKVATVGIVRACQKSADGTSNLLLQGLCRIEFLEIVNDAPYRLAKVRPLQSSQTEDAGNADLREQLARLLRLKQKYGPPLPADLAGFLKTVEDPETFVDLAAFSLCEPPALKQQLLETLSLPRRLEIFAEHIRADIAAIKLRTKLQGDLPDERIGLN